MAPHSFKFVYNPETHAIVLFNQQLYGDFQLCYDFMKKNLSGRSPFWDAGTYRVDDLPLLAAIETAGSLAACEGQNCSLACALVPRMSIHHIITGFSPRISIDFKGWLFESMDAKVQETHCPGNDCCCWKTLSGSRDKVSEVLPSVEVVVYFGDSAVRYVIFHKFMVSCAPEVHKQTVVDVMYDNGHIPPNEVWAITYKVYQGHPWHFELRQVEVCTTDSEDELESLEMYDEYLDLEDAVFNKARKPRKVRKARKPVFTALCV